MYELLCSWAINSSVTTSRCRNISIPSTHPTSSPNGPLLLFPKKAGWIPYHHIFIFCWVGCYSYLLSSACYFVLESLETTWSLKNLVKFVHHGIPTIFQKVQVSLTKIVSFWNFHDLTIMDSCLFWYSLRILSPFFSPLLQIVRCRIPGCQDWGSLVKYFTRLR